MSTMSRYIWRRRGSPVLLALAREIRHILIKRNLAQLKLAGLTNMTRIDNNGFGHGKRSVKTFGLRPLARHEEAYFGQDSGKPSQDRAAGAPSKAR